VARQEGGEVFKKPIWLRAVGWIDFAVWLWTALVLYQFFTRGPGAILMIGIWLYLVVAFALFCLWAIVSGMIWSASKNARMQAAVTRDAMKRLASDKGLAVEFPTAQTGIACAKCGSYAAVLHCNRHGESVCWRCAVKGDSPECLYILANRQQAVAAQRRLDPVHTSPLSGMRLR
jgi:hypothetical protein